MARMISDVRIIVDASRNGDNLRLLISETAQQYTSNESNIRRRTQVLVPLMTTLSRVTNDTATSDSTAQTMKAASSAAPVQIYYRHSQQ